MNILVINGPNINMLGIREPGIYGRQDYQALLDLIENTGRDLGISIDHFQSNHEGALIDAVQHAYGVADGIIINPAGYTHTSVALLDALKAVAIPFVEVHISNVESREDFRQVSYVRQAAIKTIQGQGIDGYRQAIEYLHEILAKDDDHQL